MSTHSATVEWNRQGQVFTDNRYSRAHTWRFDGGAVVPGSSSPHVVPLPYSNAAAVDPEEAFVASVSSCHMLWFLGIAAQQGWVVDSYQDTALGHMTRNEQGKLWVSRVELQPHITFSGRQPTAQGLNDLHTAAHAECFIANSIRTEVVVLGH